MSLRESKPEARRGPCAHPARRVRRAALAHGGSPAWLARLACAATVVAQALGAPAAAAMSPADTPTLRVEPGGHTSSIRQVLFAPGGRLLSAGRDKLVHVWEVAAGRQTAIWRYPIGPGRVGEVDSAALSSKGLLAIGGMLTTEQTVGDGEFSYGRRSVSIIRLFQTDDGKPAGTLTGHRGAVTGLAFTPDGGTLVSVSSWSDGHGFHSEVFTWDVARGAGKPVRLGELPTYVYGLAMSPSGDAVACACDDGRVARWDLGARKPLPPLQVGGHVTAVAWSGAANRLAVGGSDHSIRLYDGRTLAPVGSPMQQPDTVTCLAFSPDGALLASGSGDNEKLHDLNVRTWSVPDGRLLQEFGKHTSTIRAVAFSPDGTQVASADGAGVIHLWDPRSGTEIRPLRGAGSTVYRVAWRRGTPAGQYVLAWGASPDQALEHTFYTYNGQPGPDVAPADSDPADAAKWSAALHGAEGRELTVVKQDARNTSVVITDGGKRWAEIRQDSDEINCATFLSRDQVIVGSDQHIRLYALPRAPGDPKTYAREFIGNTGKVMDVALSPDGRFLASASADQTVRIWNLDEKGRDIAGVANAVEPLLSMFRGANGESVAWNDHYGYYSASAFGSKIIGLQVDRANGASEYYTPDQFRARAFNRPDVIARLAEAGSLPAALDRADAALKQQAETERQQAEREQREDEQRQKAEEEAQRKAQAAVEEAKRKQAKEAEIQRRQAEVERIRKAREAEAALKKEREEQAKRKREEEARRQKEQAEVLTAIAEKEPPPVITVEVEAPAQRQDNNAWITAQPKATLVVRVLHAAADEVDLHVAVDSSQPKRYRVPSVQGAEIRKEVDLFGGANVVKVQVHNNKTGSDSNVVVVRIAFKPPNAPAVERGSLYVLAIGVRDYAERENSLRFADHDAQAVADFYETQRKSGLWKSIMVRRVLNTDATRNNILYEMKEMQEAVHPEDTAVLFISSHGGRAPDRDEYFIVPTEHRSDEGFSDCVSLQEILRLLRDVECRYRVAILDACYSGGINQIMALRATEAGRTLTGAAVDERALQEGNVLTLTSCGDNEESWEDPDHKFGYFTFALLEGLGGKAPRISSAAEPDVLHLNDVANYVAAVVPQRVNRPGRTQRPRTLALPDLDAFAALASGVAMARVRK